MMSILTHPLLAQGSVLPAGASSTAGTETGVFHVVLWIALFLLVFVTGLLLLFVFRFRERPGQEPEAEAEGGGFLTILLGAALVVLVGVIFFAGLRAYLDKEIPPRTAYDIQVEGRNWYWLFTYPNGHSDPVLHVPVGEPVRLILHSEDVHHSFHVPAFRMTRDLIPGHSNETWFMATRTGVFPAYCSEYCGTGHSEMTTAVVVHEPGDYTAWISSVGDPYAGLSPVEAGEKVYKNNGCMACHSVDGIKLVGPSFKGIFGVVEKMRDGTEILVDEDYLKESIEDPLAKVVDGFEPIMPPYKGTITDTELDYFIEFVKSLAE